MYWNQTEPGAADAIPADVVDLLFAIDCRQLPVDHAYSLAAALLAICPWMAAEPRLAIHSIHVAGSQNGWERPAHGTTNHLQVSRRTKLTVRTPQARVPDLLARLPGTRLQVGDCPLTLGAGKVRPLSTETTLFARYVAATPATNPDADEPAFLAATAAALATLDIVMRKALCGKAVMLATPRGEFPARSLLLADLSGTESARLQHQGLGPYGLLGCGIFIPHKGIDAVANTGAR